MDRMPDEESLYRIFTENKNIEQIKATLSGLGLDFTVFHTSGSWQGKEEDSLAIELDNVSRHRAENAAMSIKSMSQQDAVLLQEIPVKSKLM